ncbi:mannose-1-phosphate guanylyltransferase/mannose-6-phosphate isomerase [bacterium]|nr:mannose-1-phosphate guanylyltransferase/mannose-6-phosphate isomerase [bacterium]
MSTLYCVILAGGLGSRLWPLSRAAYPKQNFKLNDDYTLFQQTFLRLARIADDKNIITATNVKHVSAIKEQLSTLKAKFGRKLDYKIISEPDFKNTSSALTICTKFIKDKMVYSGETPIILAVPSDQIIRNKELLASQLEKGIKLAQEGFIVAFASPTEDIDENFGYIKARKNQNISKIEPCALKVSNFIEKPKTKKQKEILKGKIYKNTGMYMFSASTYFEELKKIAPELFKLIEKEEITESIPSISLNSYEKFKDISIDYALMEETKKMALIPFEDEWTDIGSWESIHEILEKDKKGNCFVGKAIDFASENSLVYSTSKLVATVGLKDSVVVETEDAILVCDKNNTKEIKNVYEKLNGKNATAKEIHKTVYRPWGYYTVLEEGEGFLTKCIVVNPMAKLSIQRHKHRSEHWIILEGQATVIKGENTLVLDSGNSIDIAAEEIHSLQNLTDTQIKILEVQQGDILDENDIERLQDIYGRA